MIGGEKILIKRPDNTFSFVKANKSGHLKTTGGVKFTPQVLIDRHPIVFNNSAPQFSGEEIVIPEPSCETAEYYMVYVSNPSPDTTLSLSVRNGIDEYFGQIYEATIPVSSYSLFSATAWSSCFTSIGGALTDESGDLNDANGPDVPFAFAAANDAIYFGNTSKFQRMRLLVGTAGVYVATFIWEYWNGSTWATIYTVTDNTNTTVKDGTQPFKLAGWNTISFQVPTDWTSYDIAADPTQQYWIRARVVSYTSRATTPQLTQGYYKPVGKANVFGYRIPGMFNGQECKITLGNNTALSATGGFTAYVWVKEY